MPLCLSTSKRNICKKVVNAISFIYFDFYPLPEKILKSAKYLFKSELISGSKPPTAFTWKPTFA
jgi:hypothetical protein